VEQKIIIGEKLRLKIEEKAFKECGVSNLLSVSTYIHQLKKHIDGTLRLPNNEIEQKLDFLIGCMTITLDNPFINLEFLRARRSEEEVFCNVNELSYIKKPSKTFPHLGRLNSAGMSLFYASVIRPDSKTDKGLMVVLSEARARKLDRMRVLRSRQKENEDLNLRMIGIWDDIRRGCKPAFMDSKVYNYYAATYDYMLSKFTPTLLIAYQLTDRFLADIMSRKGSSKLYDVTSITSAIMLDDKEQETKIDGILYSSVEAKDEPVIVLKPEAVDAKLNHDWVTEVLIKQHYGYEFFDYETIKKFTINKKTGELEPVNQHSKS